MVSVGTKGKQSTTVAPENTAKTYGSGNLEVFATPAMVALMEKTALESVQSQLEEGWGTVGISVNVKHTAATPLGMAVTCESVVTEVDGRLLVFEVTASDERGVIGSGIHERFIINNDKFMQKVNEKSRLGE